MILPGLAGAPEGSTQSLLGSQTFQNLWIAAWHQQAEGRERLLHSVSEVRSVSQIQDSLFRCRDQAVPEIRGDELSVKGLGVALDEPDDAVPITQGERTAVVGDRDDGCTNGPWHHMVKPGSGETHQDPSAGAYGRCGDPGSHGFDRWHPGTPDSILRDDYVVARGHPVQEAETLQASQLRTWMGIDRSGVFRTDGAQMRLSQFRRQPTSSQRRCSC